MTKKTLELQPIAKENGIIKAREIEFTPEHKIIYLTIDPETANHEVLKNEAKDFWLIYNSIPKETKNDLQPTE